MGTNDDTLATVDIVAASQDTTLTVLFAINTYNVTLCTLDPAEGSMTAVTATATYGNPYDVTVRANYVNGYHVETITCGDSVATYGANIDTVINYTINSITSDTTVCATFELNEYTITATAGDNGTIEVAGENTIVWGSDTSFVITPAECYYIDVVTVDGTEISGYDTTGLVLPIRLTEPSPAVLLIAAPIIHIILRLPPRVIILITLNWMARRLKPTLPMKQRQPTRFQMYVTITPWKPSLPSMNIL